MTIAPLQSTSHLCINVLGSFSVHVARQPIAMPRNAQRMLGFLAVTGVEHLRDTVAGHLWPDAAPERAMSNLRTSLWRVRQAEPGIVRARRDSVGLSDEVEIDYEVITSQARGIIAQFPLDDQAIAGTARLLEADLLPGWDEEWLLLDRERHRQLRIHALERLSELLTERGHYGRAIDVACAAVRVEPLHESAHAALIAAHMAEGNRTEAIRHFRAYAQLLDEEAGLEPSSRLVELLAPSSHDCKRSPAATAR
jgi:DNA-binding SARP family transcriptional activator